jgi:hypothetical protein
LCRFTTESAGTITGFRFWKGKHEGGYGHTGYLYSWPEGEVLATVTIDDSDCDDDDWVSANFQTPFRTTPGQQYVVAIDSVIFYPKTEGCLREPRVSGDLTALNSVYGFELGVVPRTETETCYYVDGA